MERDPNSLYNKYKRSKLYDIVTATANWSANLVYRIVELGIDLVRKVRKP